MKTINRSSKCILEANLTLNQYMQLPLNNVLVMIYYSRPLKAIEVLEITEIVTIISYVENLIAKR